MTTTPMSEEAIEVLGKLLDHGDFKHPDLDVILMQADQVEKYTARVPMGFGTRVMRYTFTARDILVHLRDVHRRKVSWDRESPVGRHRLLINGIVTAVEGSPCLDAAVLKRWPDLNGRWTMEAIISVGNGWRPEFEPTSSSPTR